MYIEKQQQLQGEKVKTDIEIFRKLCELFQALIGLTKIEFLP